MKHWFGFHDWHYWSAGHKRFRYCPCGKSQFWWPDGLSLSGWVG